MGHLLFSLLFVLGNWNNPAPQRVKLLFAGDLMQHQLQLESAFRDSLIYDYSDCFTLVKPIVEEADISFGNLEVTLGTPPYTGYPRFNSPKEFAKAIKEAGFDVLLTANNHCLDRGESGLVGTISILDSLDINHCGTYRNQTERDSLYPLIIEKNGIRIALLNYTYGTNGMNVPDPCIVNVIDTVVMESDIIKARSMHPDCIIAFMHWGEEYQRQPDAEQRFLAKWLIARGVNHIIGDHPHVVQPMELVPDPYRAYNHLVAYSLGNYISNMSARHTDNGATVTLSLVKSGEITRLDSCGYRLIWTERPVTNRKNRFRVIPAPCPTGTLSPASESHMSESVDQTRSLLRTRNIKVTELSE